jgi:anti-sigma B factor antagonist
VNEKDIVYVTDRQGVKLVKILVSGLLTEPQVNTFGEAMLRLAEEPGRRVVLSFLGVEHLTSLALGRLIAVHKRLAETGGELRLADIDPRLYEVFSLTRLDRLFQIYEREDEAVASFLPDSET